MNLLRVNNFSEIGWHAHLLDVFFIVGLFFGVIYAYRRYVAGERIYSVILATGFLYGFILETTGMFWHASYLQGEFFLMWNFTQFDIFKESTDMPFYVPLFYPTWLLMAYKVVEPFGIRSDAARAITIGLFCLVLDVPYIIHGGQPHVGWWEWREWEVYQLWLGWPLLDGWWEMTWHALLFWSLFKIMPRIDAQCEKGSGIKAMIFWPLAVALLINVVGPVLHMPVSVPTYVIPGFRQYPLFALLIGLYGAVFLFSQKEVNRQYSRLSDVFLPAFHLTMYTIFAIADVLHEGGFKDYILVEACGLFLLAAILYYPRHVIRYRYFSMAPQKAPSFSV